MAILRIQHAVSAFADWKRAFDSDPVDRKAGGVRRYRVHRSLADPNFVVIDLDFDAIGEAEAFLERLAALWNGPARALMKDPEALILETIETVEL